MMQIIPPIYQYIPALRQEGSQQMQCLFTSKNFVLIGQIVYAHIHLTTAKLCNKIKHHSIQSESQKLYENTHCLLASIEE